MCADRVFTASYRGYVYVDADEGLHVPSASSIKKAFGLLQKPKKARYKHPLFARGMETELFLTVSLGPARDRRASARACVWAALFRARRVPLSSGDVIHLCCRSAMKGLMCRCRAPTPCRCWSCTIP